MNQHFSPKGTIMNLLRDARAQLGVAALHRIGGHNATAANMLARAQMKIADARAIMAMAPASTRRRWRAGR